VKRPPNRILNGDKDIGGGRSHHEMNASTPTTLSLSMNKSMESSVGLS